ncbi:MAG: single-stranded DNA-binding protein [Clostridiales bacterium]|nr:single-stranded DNA-binding protein [Clostridiales bacterium]
MTVYEGIAEILADTEAIKKDKLNQQQGFKFRGIDDVYNAVHPLFAKHGVFTVPTVLDEYTEERTTRSGGNLIYRILKIKYTFFSKDGTSLDAVVIGEGMDSGDKAANKAMAVGHKYALLQVLQIPTEDMIDPDSESQEPTTKAKEQKVKVEQKEPEKPEQKFAKISENNFDSKEAYFQLVDIAGDDELVKEQLKTYGAYSTKDLTYQIYEGTLKYLTMKKGVKIA